MRTVRIEKTIEAPIDQVFGVLTAHADYKKFRGVRDSSLVREGTPQANGAGALRRVVIGPLTFEEEITRFESAVGMDYVIRKINAPLEHQGGSIDLRAFDQGTRVVWTSTFEVKARVLGGLLTSVAAILIRLGFISVLRDTDRMLTRA